MHVSVHVHTSFSSVHHRNFVKNVDIDTEPLLKDQIKISFLLFKNWHFLKFCTKICLNITPISFIFIQHIFKENKVYFQN